MHPPPSKAIAMCSDKSIETSLESAADEESGDSRCSDGFGSRSGANFAGEWEKNSRPVYVSTTVQSVLGVNEDTDTFKALVEIDFKYNASDYLDLLGKYPPTDLQDANKMLGADDLVFPWIITNASEITPHRSFGFFRKVFSSASERDTSRCITPPSIYHNASNGDNVHHSIRRDEAADFWKCEKHVLTVECSYHTKEKYKPFDRIYLFIKIATDGRPGTEKMAFVYHEEDSCFIGFSKRLKGGFCPKDSLGYPKNKRDCKAEVIVYKYLPSHMNAYPRLYISKCYKSSPTESIIKFYLIPALIFIILVTDQMAGPDLLSISSSLILADIALLFCITSCKNTVSHQEQAIIVNTVLLIGCTMLLHICNQSGNPADLSFHALAVGMICINVVINAVMIVYHYKTATYAQDRIESDMKKVQEDSNGCTMHKMERIGVL